MTADERRQVFANALKLFTDESPEAVKALAMLGVLPDKLSFGPEGQVIFAGPNDPSTYTRIASEDGRPIYWEVSSQPYGQDLTPVQQHTLRRYGFTVPGDPKPCQARAERRLYWMDVVLKENEQRDIDMQRQYQAD